MNAYDELLNLHGPLTSDAQKQPEYRDNTETAIYGYSEGVEHALETVRAKGYRKPRTISEGTRVSLVDSLLAYKGTPRHKLFEYPHRDDDSRAMIREAEAVVTAILAVLHEPTPGGPE